MIEFGQERRFLRSVTKTPWRFEVDLRTASDQILIHESDQYVSRES